MSKKTLDYYHNQKVKTFKEKKKDLKKLEKKLKDLGKEKTKLFKINDSDCSRRLASQTSGKSALSLIIIK